MPGPTYTEAPLANASQRRAVMFLLAGLIITLLFVALDVYDQYTYYFGIGVAISCGPLAYQLIIDVTGRSRSPVVNRQTKVD